LNSVKISTKKVQVQINYLKSKQHGQAKVDPMLQVHY